MKKKAAAMEVLSMINFELWKLIELDFKDKGHKQAGNQYNTIANFRKDNSVNENQFLKITLVITKSIQMDLDTSIEHEMNSINSNALNSDYVSKGILNIRAFNENNE
ncbi:hypothetical protein RI543_001997 [Arxiozyma heterogenica]|uniref:Uncharacterized protein n=1 Tax=Arxiozyma heterogenica TaxID=278026 RepID=A0AAN8A997_9SACH|nr:hypothetical protein RI543_001997 [Kazachstania heterogenica]